MQVYDPWCVCVCVCPVQAPSPSHRLPPGHRTLSREDTRTTRTTTAASWPTRPREDITTPRNTKTLSCKAGKAGSDIITDQNSSNFLSCRQFQTLFTSLVVQKAWCPHAHKHTQISLIYLCHWPLQKLHSWCFNVNILLVSVIYILFSRLYSGTQFVPTVCHHHTVKCPMFGRIRSIKEI